jgi:ribonuclease D
MLAVQVLDGTGRQLSLAETVRRFLDRDLSKGLQTADWGGPLSPAMLDYAAQDATVLLPLFTILTERARGGRAPAGARARVAGAPGGRVACAGGGAVRQ